MPRHDPDRLPHPGRTSAERRALDRCRGRTGVHAVTASRAHASASGQNWHRGGTPIIEAAAAALLRTVVTGERERSAVANPEWRTGRPWVDTLAPRASDALDVPGLAADPVGTACRAELRRIGHALHAANPGEDFVALAVEVDEMDPTHTDWRLIVLERAWSGIGGPTS